MKAASIAELIRQIDFYGYVRSMGEDVARGYAWSIPRNEMGEVDIYWRSKKAMLKYFHRCREIDPSCLYPMILFLSKLFPESTWRPSDVIVIRHRWFEKDAVKTFVV